MPVQYESPLLVNSTSDSDPAISAATRQNKRFRPAAPGNLADAGLSGPIIEQLILKFLYFKGDIMGGDLSRLMGLRFSLIEDMIEGLKLQLYIQVKSSLGFGSVSSVLCLTELGRRIARDYLENNQYVGPAPVPIDQYREAVMAQ